MLSKTIVLKSGYSSCSFCRGDHLRADTQKICPYLSKIIYEFLEKRNLDSKDGKMWEQTRYFPEKGEGLAQCSVRYQADSPGHGLITVEASFRTEYKDISMRGCSVFLKVKGGPEEHILNGLVDLLSK